MKTDSYKLTIISVFRKYIYIKYKNFMKFTISYKNYDYYNIFIHNILLFI